MQEEDEISLIDLIVIIIKHRRLIMIVTALSALIAAMVILLLPRLGFAPKEAYVVRATTIASRLPPVLGAELGIDLKKAFIQYAQNASEVENAAIRNGILSNASIDVESTRVLPNAFDKSFIGKKYKVTESAEKINVEVVTNNAQGGLQFLNEVIANAESSLRTEISARSSAISLSMEGAKRNNPTDVTFVDSAKQIQLMCLPYLEGKIPTIIVTSQPAAFKNSQSGEAKKIIMIAGIAFFMAVLLSFIIDYIERIKADPETIDKFRKALRKQRH